MTKETKKNNWIFLGGMALLAIFFCYQYFEGAVNDQDTTVFAFSYRYGFISRGLMGSLLAFWDSLTAADLMSYHTIYRLSLVANLLYFLLLFGFFAVCLKRIRQEENLTARALIVYLGILAFPMYQTKDNFGRLDVYLTILMFLCMILLVTKKCRWLILPLCVIAMLIHQGFVFMNINILLVLLFIQWLYATGKEKRWLLTLLLLTFFAVSGLFLYFELFSHSDGTAIYDEIYALAQKLSIDGKTANDSILNHEILGLDVYEDEYWYHRLNRFEFPVFLVLYLPFEILGIRYFIGLFRRQTDKKGKWMAAAYLLGAITVVPEMILKVDYGRYMFAIFFYYAALTLALLALGEKTVEAQLTETALWLKNHMAAAGGLLMYAVLFTPLRAVRICDVISEITYFGYGFH